MKTSTKQDLRWFGARLPSLSIIVLLLLPISMNAKTFVRPDPASYKTLLYVDGDGVYTDSGNGGKRIFTIDSDGFICDGASGKRLLLVESGGDIRPGSANGVRIAVWDGEDLRRTPGGPRLGFADRHDGHGQEIRPEPGFKRFFYLEGDKLTLPQLTAVLYKLKPELFKLTQAEESAAAAAIKEGDEWTKQQAAPEAQVGKFEAFSGSGPFMRKHFTMSWANEHFHVQSPDPEPLDGAAIKYSSSGEHIIGALSTGKVQVGLFKYKDGKYSGRWIKQLGTPKVEADNWTTEMEPTGQFASKLGKLKFTKQDVLFADQSTILKVEGEKGETGYALRYGNEASGGGLIVALGAGAGVFFLDASGTMLNGEYYAGPERDGRLVMDLQRD